MMMLKLKLAVFFAIVQLAQSYSTYFETTDKTTCLSAYTTSGTTCTAECAAPSSSTTPPYTDCTSTSCALNAFSPVSPTFTFSGGVLSAYITGALREQYLYPGTNASQCAPSTSACVYDYSAVNGSSGCSTMTQSYTWTWSQLTTCSGGSPSYTAAFTTDGTNEWVVTLPLQYLQSIRSTVFSTSYCSAFYSNFGIQLNFPASVTASESSVEITNSLAGAATTTSLYYTAATRTLTTTLIVSVEAPYTMSSNPACTGSGTTDSCQVQSSVTLVQVGSATCANSFCTYEFTFTATGDFCLSSAVGNSLNVLNGIYALTYGVACDTTQYPGFGCNAYTTSTGLLDIVIPDLGSQTCTPTVFSAATALILATEQVTVASGTPGYLVETATHFPRAGPVTITGTFAISQVTGTHVKSGYISSICYCQAPASNGACSTAPAGTVSCMTSSTGTAWTATGPTGLGTPSFNQVVVTSAFPDSETVVENGDSTNTGSYVRVTFDPEGLADSIGILSGSTAQITLRIEVTVSQLTYSGTPPNKKDSSAKGSSSPTSTTASTSVGYTFGLSSNSNSQSSSSSGSNFNTIAIACGVAGAVCVLAGFAIMAVFVRRRKVTEPAAVSTPVKIIPAVILMSPTPQAHHQMKHRAQSLAEDDSQNATV